MAVRTIPLKDLSGGVNKDLAPYELALDTFSDAVNFIPRNGFMEKFGGTKGSGSALTVAPYWMHIHEYSGTRYLLNGGSGSVYATASNISPYGAPKVVSSATRIDADTAEVTTATAHGLTTGDIVATFGFTESAYNMTSGATITVMSSTVFRYDTTNTISGNATVLGGYVVWSGSYLTLNTSPNARDKMTGGSINGLALVNLPTEAPMHWVGNTSYRLRRFPFGIGPCTAARPFKEYIVFIGPTVLSLPALTGTQKKQSVAWTDSFEEGAMPTTITASATNDAGIDPFSDAKGDLVDGLTLDDVFIVYAQGSYHEMRYIGGNDVFSFRKLDDAGLLAPNCVVDVPGVGHVFLTPTLDVRVHQGGKSRSILDGRLRNWLTSTIYSGSTRLERLSFLVHHPLKSEVHVWFPTDNTEHCKSCIVWNYKEDKLGIITPPTGTNDLKTTFACSGLWQVTKATGDLVRDTMLLGGNATLAGFLFDDVTEDTGNWSGTAMTGTLERTGLHFDDYETFKTLDGVLLNIDGDSGETDTVYTGSHKTADGTVTWTSGGTLTLGTTKFVDQRATAGPFVGWKLSTTAFPRKVRSGLLRISGGGKR